VAKVWGTFRLCSSGGIYGDLGCGAGWLLVGVGEPGYHGRGITTGRADVGHLGFSTWEYGIVFAVPCIGGLAGSRVVPAVVARFGEVSVLRVLGTLRAFWPVGLALVVPGLSGITIVMVIELGLIVCCAVLSRARRPPIAADRPDPAGAGAHCLIDRDHPQHCNAHLMLRPGRSDDRRARRLHPLRGLRHRDLPPHRQRELHPPSVPRTCSDESTTAATRASSMSQRAGFRSDDPVDYSGVVVRHMPAGRRVTTS